MLALQFNGNAARKQVSLRRRPAPRCYETPMATKINNPIRGVEPLALLTVVFASLCLVMLCIGIA